MLIFRKIEGAISERIQESPLYYKVDLDVDKRYVREP